MGHLSSPTSVLSSVEWGERTELVERAGPAQGLDRGMEVVSLPLLIP